MTARRLAGFWRTADWGTSLISAATTIAAPEFCTAPARPGAPARPPSHRRPPPGQQRRTDTTSRPAARSPSRRRPVGPAGQRASGPTGQRRPGAGLPGVADCLAIGAEYGCRTAPTCTRLKPCSRPGGSACQVPANAAMTERPPRFRTRPVCPRPLAAPPTARALAFQWSSPRGPFGLDRKIGLSASAGVCRAKSGPSRSTGTAFDRSGVERIMSIRGMACCQQA